MNVKFNSTTMEASIKKLEWPSSSSPINGFNSKYELLQQMKNPLDGMQVIRIGTENFSEISFYKDDILSFELSNPDWFYNENYPKNKNLRCMLSHGSKILISAEADCLDRFDDGPDAEIAGRKLPLFERIIHFPDIVDIDFIYDDDYWIQRESEEDYGIVEVNKFIRFCVPYVEWDSFPDNELQKGRIDEQGNLNIEWIEEPEME